MNNAYQILISETLLQLAANIELMDLYAKFEITERDHISESLLYADSMKALDRAGKKLNEAHRKQLSQLGKKHS